MVEAIFRSKEEREAAKQALESFWQFLESLGFSEESEMQSRVDTETASDVMIKAQLEDRNDIIKKLLYRRNE